MSSALGLWCAAQDRPESWRRTVPEFLTTDGVRLAYSDNGSGPLVVCSAGFTLPAESWFYQERALLEAGYRVVCLDRRGHGASEAPDHGQRIARHGRDLAELLDLLDAHDTTLIGGSMGASTIWAYIDGAGTARVGRVVSVDQTPKMVNSDGWGNGFYGLTPQNVGTFFADGIPPTGMGLDEATATERTGRLIADLGQMPAFADPRDPKMQPLLQDHAERDWRDVISRLDRPALMIAGELSQFWPPQHALEMARANPVVDAVIIEGAGHSTNMEDPESVNDAILTFMSKTGADRPGRG